MANYISGLEIGSGCSVHFERGAIQLPVPRQATPYRAIYRGMVGIPPGVSGVEDRFITILAKTEDGKTVEQRVGPIREGAFAFDLTTSRGTERVLVKNISQSSNGVIYVSNEIPQNSQPNR